MERNVELSQTHQRRDSLASWEVWPLLLVDLGSPLASPVALLFPLTAVATKVKATCMCVCVRAPGSAWAIWSLLLPQRHHSIWTPDSTTGVQFSALPQELCDLR